jgi:hypothetical protein
LKRPHRPHRRRNSSDRNRSLWDLSDQLEPEDGKFWVYDIDGDEILAFTAEASTSFEK